MGLVINKSSLRTLIMHLYKRTPLALKMLVVVVVVGLIVWAVLEYVQTRHLENVFQKQLAERLSKKSMEDRLLLDRYIKAYLHSVNLFVSQKKFSDYIEKQKWSTEDIIHIKYYRRAPPWFPGRSVLRTFIQPRYALLLDNRRRVREVYQSSRGESLSPSLLQPSQLLILKSEGQSFITTLEDNPYLVSSASFSGSQGELLGRLMIASPIDEVFLNAALGYRSPGYKMALLTLGENPQILTSTDLVDIPPGTPVKALEGRYLVTGREYFDYGAAEHPIRFVSFFSMEEVNLLTKSIVSRERRQRVIASLVFILTFALLMYWITHRIQKLTKRISNFSDNVLGISTGKEELTKKGDQLYILDERFQRLTEEVVEAREALNKEFEEKLILQKKSMEMEQKNKQLRLLQSVTETLGVGVIINSSNGLQIANQQMKYLAHICGGLSAFEIQDGGSVERLLLDNNGTKHIFDISSHTIFDEKILLVCDITELKAKTDVLEHMALHDALTGLPNRTLLHNRLKHAILVAQREHKSLALLMMDLDRFKEINDTLGHRIGDLVLKEVGERLQGALRKTDTVARLGGDEFAVLLPFADAEHAQQTAHKLINSLERPFMIEGNNLYVGMSIGIAVYPEHGRDVDTLMKRVDMTMYVSKQKQDKITIYNPHEDVSSLEQLTLVDELHYGIEHDELILHYQPRVSYRTGHIIGVEALARWQHPQRGLILPAEFISLAERTGFIKSLTLWVLDTALRQCADWHREGVNINVSVNLSVRNLQDIQFPGEVVERLKRCGVSPTCLELEITESAMMVDPGRAMKILKQLNAIGVRLSIDNFGTGYSSIAYLRSLPVDEIKVDRFFIMNMMVDEHDATIVRYIIDLAHNLGFKVIAEGVERQEVWDMLRKLGCDAAQGFYISRPLTVPELTRWLRESPWGLEKKDK